MDRYEYRWQWLPLNDIAVTLNAAGQDGWRVVHFDPDHANVHVLSERRRA